MSVDAPGRLRAGVLACLALIAWVSFARAGDESEAEKIDDEEKQAESAVPGELAKAFEESRAKLESLGLWCVNFEMDLERSRVADAILLFDRDHAKAREWLGAKRQKNGSWKLGPWRAFVDQHPERMADYAKRRDEGASAFHDRLVPLFEKCRTPRTAGPRDRIVRALADLYPEEARWHEAYGEVQVAGKWVLRESAATPKNRLAIAAAVEQARADAKQAARRPPTTARKWPCGITGDRIEIVSTLDDASTADVFDAVMTVESAYGRMLGVPAKLPGRGRVYLLENAAENLSFLRRIPDLDPVRRASLEKLASYWIGEECVIARSLAADRVDTAVRQMLGRLEGPCERLKDVPPCLSEGIGMYVTYKVVGTRLTAFITGDRDYSDEGLGRETANVEADWVLVAKKLVDKGFALDLPVLLGLPLNAMGKDDSLLAYAFGAYLVEGRPADTVALLRALKVEHPNLQNAIAQTLGVDEEGLQPRFVRWLREIPLK